MKSKLCAALAAGWCVLTLSAGAANADIITLNVVATMAPAGSGNAGTATCSTVCTLAASYLTTAPAISVL
jgi:hypothetical protein